MKDMISNTTTSNFQFSGVTVDRLGASEYTLVTLAIDMSSSVSPFKKELIDSISSVIDACKKSPRAENLMLRLITFNDSTYEEHGFKTLSEISINDYQNISNPSGMTALYDASLNSVESISSYGDDLMKNDIDVNGIVFVITDGLDNRSKNNAQDVKKSVKNALINETLESLRMILVGVNTKNDEIQRYLSSFKDAAGFDQYINIEDADASSLAKFANFVSKSISAQSQALGTGGQSKALVF